MEEQLKEKLAALKARKEERSRVEAARTRPESPQPPVVDMSDQSDLSNTEMSENSEDEMDGPGHVVPVQSLNKQANPLQQHLPDAVSSSPFCEEVRVMFIFC